MRPTPVASRASRVSAGMSSKLWAKARVKKAVVWTQRPAMPAAGPMPTQTIMRRTQTGVGTARRKVKAALMAEARKGTRRTFSAASMPKRRPRSMP